MKYKKLLIIIFSVLFFLAALTFYLNRVIFPQLIKKIAVQRIEDALKRKVEIGSIHLNWVRGFIIDKIKIYEKSPDDVVFAQADQVSFGILFFPGFKHYRITIPFINIRSPSVHLIRTKDNTWNFSDLYTPVLPTASPAPSSTKTDKPSPFEIAWGGITISDGKLMIEDDSTPHPWSEYLENINLKLALSYKGISYDFAADIPGKKGFVGAIVYYQPITKNTQAQIHLKNIDTASYMSLFDFPDVHLDNGTIKEINLNISHTEEETSAQGDVLMTNLDLTSHDQTFKGSIELRHLNALYRHGDISARGQMTLTDVQTKVPGLSAGGNVQANVNDFEYSKEGVAFAGSLHAQNIFVGLKDRQVQVEAVTMDNIKVKKDKNGVQSVGSVITKGLFVQWPDQKFQGDLALKNLTLRMKDMNDITVEGELEADNVTTTIGHNTLSSRRIVLDAAQMNILDQKNITLNTKMSSDELALGLGKDFMVSGSLRSDKLMFDLNDGNVKISTNLSSSNGKMVLDHHKTIEANPQLELTLAMPLNDPKQVNYKGSITLSDAVIRGFAPFAYLDNINLDVDFQNDQATINALSADILDSNVRVNGTVKDFKDPVVDIVAETDELNLSKIKELAPQIVDQYGLSFDGTSTVKVKFNGHAKDPLAGNILAVLTVKNVNANSSKFHQHLKNITGIIEATPNSLKLRDTTASFQGQKYSLAGSLEDFKAPKVLFSIDGPNLHLNGDIKKDKDLVTIHSLTGKYLNAAFDSKGKVSLSANGPDFDINSNVSMLLEDLVKMLPEQQKKGITPLDPSGMISLAADIKGSGQDWKKYTTNATITSPAIRLMGYSLNNMKINIVQDEGKVKNLTFDGQLYDGTVHAVGSMDLSVPGMPYELALNVDSCDLHKLKMDSPLKMEEINGKFFLTTLAHGTVSDFKNNLQASGSTAIRDGFLAEFNLFKGLLGILNDAMRLGQVMITDVEGNFNVANQKITTDNLRLKGPTIVLLSKGWVNFDLMCDLDVTVDLSSGVVPDIAHDVLNSLNIHIYDKIADPKFKKKISMPQVINTLIKNFLQ